LRTAADQPFFLTPLDLDEEPEDLEDEEPDRPEDEDRPDEEEPPERGALTLRPEDEPLDRGALMLRPEEPPEREGAEKELRGREDEDLGELGRA